MDFFFEINWPKRKQEYRQSYNFRRDCLYYEPALDEDPVENEWAECFLLDLVPELKVCQVKSEFFNGIINYVEKRTIFEHSLSKGDARTGGSLAKGPPEDLV